ncbi:MAG: WG repeat-containing protein [Phormidesmis sp.]
MRSTIDCSFISLRFSLRLAVSSLFASVVGLSSLASPAAAAPTFRDTQTHWANACVDRLAQQNKLRGYPDGSFRPDGRLTRAEYATLMLNSFPATAGGEANSTVPNFRDLPSPHWAYNTLRAAYQRGILVGYPDGTMRPDQPINRAEAIALLYRLVSPNSTDTHYYSSFNSIPRFPLTQDPQRILSELFSDAAEVPSWAKSGVAAAAAGFMVVDYPNGNMMRSQEPTTRAEAAAFLCQAAGLDGLVPTTAVAGYQYFTQSAELKKLLLAQTNGQQGWFDPQRERAIIATPPPGWRIIQIGKLSENRVSAIFENEENVSKSGFFDADGAVVIAPNQFDKAGDFSEGLAAVSQAGTYGFVDTTGKLVTFLQFKAVQPFSEGLAAVQISSSSGEKQWGFVDKTGAWAIAPQPYLSISSFSEGLARIEVPDANRAGSSLHGFIDKTGQVAIAPQFTWAQSFSEGLAGIGYEQADTSRAIAAYIDRSGQKVIDNLAWGIEPFSEGLAARSILKVLDRPPYSESPQYGYIDKTGQWVIEPRSFFGDEATYVRSAGPFTSGFAQIVVGNRHGLINREGGLAAPPVFSDIQEIANGYAYVNYGGTLVSYAAYYNNDTPQTETTLRGGRWGYIKLPSPDSLTEPPLNINNNSPLPPLTPDELSRLKSEGTEYIQSWINLAGVGATSNPTEFTPALQTLNQQQQARNPRTAPFLGLWQGEPPASGYPYYLSIFPATEADQVCIIEYQQGQQIAFEVFPATFTLSKATVAQGNLLSPRLRSTQSASQVQPYYNGTAKFLTALQPTENNRVHPFSLTDKSALYNSFSPRMLSDLSQALPELGCTTDVLKG